MMLHHGLVSSHHLWTVLVGFQHFWEVWGEKFKDFFLSRPSIRRNSLKVIMQKAGIVDRLAAITKFIADGIQETIPHWVIFFSTVFL